MGKVYFNRRGFTLMEMLVAVTIFGIIILILIPEFMNAQKKSRDARRKADLGKISEALEEYRSDYGFYPTPIPTIFAVGPMVGPSGEYLKSVPLDPKYKTDYCYITSANNLSYILSALFELEQSECPWAPTGTPTPTAGPTAPPGGPTATPTATPTLPVQNGCPGGTCYTLNPNGGSCCTNGYDLYTDVGQCNGSDIAGNADYSSLPHSGTPSINGCTLNCPIWPNYPEWRSTSDSGTCGNDAIFVETNSCSGLGCGTITNSCLIQDANCGEGYRVGYCLCL